MFKLIIKDDNRAIAKAKAEDIEDFDDLIDGLKKKYKGLKF